MSFVRSYFSHTFTICNTETKSILTKFLILLTFCTDFHLTTNRFLFLNSDFVLVRIKKVHIHINLMLWNIRKFDSLTIRLQHNEKQQHGLAWICSNSHCELVKCLKASTAFIIFLANVTRKFITIFFETVSIQFLRFKPSSSDECSSRGFYLHASSSHSILFSFHFWDATENHWKRRNAVFRKRIHVTYFVEIDQLLQFAIFM